MNKLLKREKRLKDRIKLLTDKKKELTSLHKTSKNEKQRFFVMSQIEQTDKLIKTFEDKLRIKQENYFKEKKPAFFYIENDPIPKDFYEYYSTLDSKMVDNLVSRALSQPKSVEQDKDAKKMLMYITAAAIAAAIAAFLAFQNNGYLNSICATVGAACG